MIARARGACFGILVAGTLPLGAAAQVVVKPPQISADPVASRVGRGSVGGKPAWVVQGVPDTVWVLAEAAAAADGDLAKELLLEAETHARASLLDHEDDVGRRFALAAVLGLRSNREGGRTKIRAASQLQDELDVILELDAEHARARHLLGRLHAGVRRMNRVTRWVATNLLGGDRLKKATWEEAERNLFFAEQRVPYVSDHHLQLANLYRDTDRRELAIAEAEHVLDLPAESPMAAAVLEEAHELIQKLGRGR
jgi:hypothetical protein